MPGSVEPSNNSCEPLMGLSSAKPTLLLRGSADMISHFPGRQVQLPPPISRSHRIGAPLSMDVIVLCRQRQRHVTTRFL